MNPAFPKYLKPAVAAVLLFSAGVALAEYPDRPIRLVVPFPPGGTADTIARVISERMSRGLKQQVVVDFKPGAATIIGAETASKSNPDGYTLFLGSATTFAVNPIIYRKLPYSADSFDPIGIVGSNALVLLANKDVPANNLPDLLKLVKANPDKYSYGSHGSGSTVHFAGEMLWSAAQAKVLHVAYKGSSPAITDLMGGQIPLSFDAVPVAVSVTKGDKVKAIAVTGAKRATQLPNVPTIAESGFPGFKLEAWWAIVGPKGMPDDVRQKLEKELAATMSDAGVRDKLTTAGFEPGFAPGSQYRKNVAEDTARLTPIARSAHIEQN